MPPISVPRRRLSYGIGNGCAENQLGQGLLAVSGIDAGGQRYAMMRAIRFAGIEVTSRTPPCHLAALRQLAAHPLPSACRLSLLS